MHAVAQEKNLNPFKIIREEFPKWWSDVEEQMYYEMIEQKGISLLLGEVSRWTGHTSAALLTTSVTFPVTAPLLAEPGAFLGVVSTGTGVAGAAWDGYFYSNDLSTTSASVGLISEFVQQNLTSMVPGPVKPFAYTGMEIYQSGFREIFYQLGQ